MLDKKLRIAFVDYVLEPDKPGRSGLSDIVWDMASELINQGHESHVIASYYTHKYPDPRVTVHNFPTPPIGYRNVVGHFWILKRAAAIAKHLQPDIIQTPEYVSTAVFAAVGVRCPLILTVPGNVFHRIQYGHSYEWYYLQVLKWAARISARHCASVIAISKEMKTWWELTGSAPERTPWIPLGINPDRFHYSPNAREERKLSESKLVLLYAGRFSMEKGLNDLIEALSRIKPLSQIEGVQIILIGKGPQASELKERISKEGLDQMVRMYSWVPQDELKYWYSAADALILPSHSEAFSRTILEALICGTPVIGTRITGTEDHIRDGVNGFLFPAGDVQALVDILVKVIQSPDILHRMRSSTLRYAQAHLTWPVIVRRIVDEVYIPTYIDHHPQAYHPTNGT